MFICLIGLYYYEIASTLSRIEEEGRLAEPEVAVLVGCLVCGCVGCCVLCSLPALLCFNSITSSITQLSHQPAIRGRSLVHIPAATHRHRRYPRYYTYRKHRNFLTCININNLENIGALYFCNINLLIDHLSMFHSAAVELINKT